MSLVETLLFHVEQVEPRGDVDLMMLKFSKSDNVSQKAPVPIVFDFIHEPCEERAIPFE